jgi:hypothetical protein
VLKKSVIFFFLVTFLFQALVFNLCLYSFTLLAKFEINAAKIQQLEFSEQEYDKLKLNETEFLYNNSLYDIVSSKTENGTIKLFCKADAKEKDFLEKLIESFKNSKTKKQVSFSFLAELHKPINLKTQPLYCANIKHSFFTTHVLKSSKNKTTPPPKA